MKKKTEKQTTSSRKDEPRETGSMFSFTRFNKFRLCPALYEAEYVKGLRMPESPLWAYHRNIHKTLADMVEKFKDFSETDPFDIAAWVNNELPKVEINPEKEISRFLRVAEYLSDKQEIIVEKEFVLDLGGIKLKIKPDNIHICSDGTVRILDFKGTFTTLTEEELKDDFQLNIYAYVVKKIMFPNIPNVKIEIGHWYWHYGYHKFVSWDNGEDVYSEVMATASKIADTKEFKRTVNQFYCNSSNCPNFKSCKPDIVLDEYGYCRDMRDFWAEKMASKKPEIFEHFNALGVSSFDLDNYNYKLGVEKVRIIDKGTLLHTLLEKHGDKAMEAISFKIEALDELGYAFSDKDGQPPEGKAAIPVLEQHFRPKLFCKKITRAKT